MTFRSAIVSIHYGTETWDSTGISSATDVDAAGKFYYNSTTGELVFATTHFSQFLVSADEVAYNENTNTAYSTLNSAISAVQSGETIETISLLKDISSTDCFLISKDVIVNGNGHKLTTSATRGFRITMGNTDVTIKNLVLNGTSVCERGIQIDGGAGLTNISLSIENTTTDTTYGVFVNQATNVNLSIDNSNLSGLSAVYIDSNYSNIEISNSVLEGINNTTSSTYFNYGTVYFNSSHASNNTLILTNCKLYAIANNTSTQDCVYMSPSALSNTLSLLNCQLERIDNYYKAEYGLDIIVYAGYLYPFVTLNGNTTTLSGCYNSSGESLDFLVD